MASCIRFGLAGGEYSLSHFSARLLRVCLIRVVSILVLWLGRAFFTLTSAWCVAEPPLKYSHDWVLTTFRGLKDLEVFQMAVHACRGCGTKSLSDAMEVSGT